MVKKCGRVGENRNLVRAYGFGFAIYLLAGMTLAWGQDVQTAPAAQAVADPNALVAAKSSPDTHSISISDYSVSPEDLLEIVVMDVPEVSRTYRVSSNGFLDRKSTRLNSSHAN